MKRTNIRGTSLVETTIVVGILAAAILAAGSLASLISSSKRSSENKMEATSLAQAIAGSLRYGALCDKAIGPGSGLDITVDETKIQQGFSNSTGFSIPMKLPNINSGKAMNGDIIDATDDDKKFLLTKRLELRQLKLANAVELPPIGSSRRWLASVYVQHAEFRGLEHRPEMIGTLSLQTSASNKIEACETSSAETVKAACEEIGDGTSCVYDASSTPPCRCPKFQQVCIAPGYFPVSFSASGVPDCRPFGGKSCPDGEYITEVGIDYIACAPAPTSITPVTATASPTPVPTASPSVPTKPEYFLAKSCVKKGNKKEVACGEPVIHEAYIRQVCTGNIISGDPELATGSTKTTELPDWQVPNPVPEVAGAKCVVAMAHGYSTKKYKQYLSFIYFDGPSQPNALSVPHISKINQ